MSKLVAIMSMSLDGYVADADGNFDWAAPGDEGHRFVNELERPIGTYLYGRRMYETMVYWEAAPEGEEGRLSASEDFGRVWRAAEKVVYSRTLGEASSARTRLRSIPTSGCTRLTRAA